MNDIDFIKQKLAEHRYKYIDISNDNSIIKIKNLFAKNDETLKPENEIEYLYFGVYYTEYNPNVERMEGYFVKAAKLKNKFALNNLGDFYLNNDKINLGLRYLKLSSEMNCGCAYLALGNYYYRKKQTDKAIKFFKKGAELDNSSCIQSLGIYYQQTKDYKNMKKYHGKGIDKNNKISIKYLGLYYFYIERNTEETKKCQKILKKKEMCKGGLSILQGVNTFKLADMLLDYDLTKMNNDEFQNNLGVYYYFIEGNKDKAKECFQRVLTRDYGLNNLGLMFCYEKNYDVGLPLLERASKKNNLESIFFQIIYYTSIVKNQFEESRLSNQLISKLAEKCGLEREPESVSYCEIKKLLNQCRY